MELTLLGTGTPEGLPRPGCPCAACAVSVGPLARAATSLLVDGALLLDLTPGAVLAGARAGHSLAGVRQVLLTHPHDGPPVELPPGLPAAGRVPDGRELAVISGHRVRAVPMDAPGTGYEVTGPDGSRLLYLPPGGAPAGTNGAMAERPYDMVLADVLGRPEALARLRASGAAGPTTDVIAVHLDHGVPPGRELQRRCAAAGARAVPDGATVTVGEYHAVPDLPRRTLVRRSVEGSGVVYAATSGSRDGDAEWAARVGLHREAGGRTCEALPLLGGLTDAWPGTTRGRKERAARTTRGRQQRGRLGRRPRDGFGAAFPGRARPPERSGGRRVRARPAGGGGAGAGPEGLSRGRTAGGPPQPPPGHPRRRSRGGLGRASPAVRSGR